MFSKLKPNFTKVFKNNKNNCRYFHSPGRVTLIGEHVAFSGGNILAANVNYGFYAVVAPREDKKIGLYSLNYKNGLILDLNKISFSKKIEWTNHFSAIITYFQKMKLPLIGLDILIYSNIPIRAGFSSSSALQILVALIFDSFNNNNMKKDMLAKIANKCAVNIFKQPEHISEPLPIAVGKKDNYTLIDCMDLRHRNIPTFKSIYKFLIIKSHVQIPDIKDLLIQRQQQNDQALRKIQTRFPKKRKLSELSIDELENCFDILDIKEKKQCMHIVTENNRVKEIVVSLKNKDIFTFGKNMYASHLSLKNDYNITSPETDMIVDISHTMHGVLGAKMCGDGFGGSVIILLENKIEKEFTKLVTETYYKNISEKVKIFPLTFQNAAKEVKS